MCQRRLVGDQITNCLYVIKMVHCTECERRSDRPLSGYVCRVIAHCLRACVAAELAGFLWGGLAFCYYVFETLMRDHSAAASGGRGRGLPAGIQLSDLLAAKAEAIPGTYDTGNPRVQCEFFDTRQVGVLRVGYETEAY